MCLHCCKLVLSLLLVAIVLLSSGCSPGPKAAVHESWTLMELLTKNEKRESLTEVVDVRNCGSPEQKSISCSAGTSSDFSVNLGGGIGIRRGVDVSIDAGISTSLGFDRSSGESLELQTPSEGTVNRYVVRKEYRIISGKVRVRSASGQERDGTYAFHASCSLRIEDVEPLTCTEADDSPIPTSEGSSVSLPTATPGSEEQKTPPAKTSTPKSTIDPSRKLQTATPTVTPLPSSAYVQLVDWWATEAGAVAVDRNGDLFLPNCLEGKVCKMTSGGETLGTVNCPPSDSLHGGAPSPFLIAVDGAGSFLVREGHKLVTYDPLGVEANRVSAFVSAKYQKTSSSWHMLSAAIGGAPGEFYLLDASGGGVVFLVDATETFEDYFGLGFKAPRYWEEGELSASRGFWLGDMSGIPGQGVWIAEAEAKREDEFIEVFEISSDASSITAFKLDNPSYDSYYDFSIGQIAVTYQGNLLIESRRSLYCFETNGSLRWDVDLEEILPRLREVRDMAAGPDGLLFIVDYSGRTLWILKPDC